MRQELLGPQVLPARPQKAPPLEICVVAPVAMARSATSPTFKRMVSPNQDHYGVPLPM
jgi:hypothetical protein